MSWIKANWPAPKNVYAGTTTRQSEYSKVPYERFKVAIHEGEDPYYDQANQALIKQLTLPSTPVWLRQCHGTRVITADSTTIPMSFEADASFSRSPHVVCAVLTADCLPILVCNRAGTEIAAIHAGWRGLLAGIIEKTISRLQSPANELLVWLGPAIGPQAFEVGEEVYDQFIQSWPRSYTAFQATQKADRWLADIYELARQRLCHCGVTAIYGGNFCTVNDTERFFSYRRDKQKTGRMASLIWFIPT